MMYGWGWGGWIAMTVLMVLFWAAIITAIVVGVRYLSHLGELRDRGSERPARSAEDVLAERFARGEIDEDEYRRRVSTLREHR